jgi:hypothetical protein
VNRLCDIGDGGFLVTIVAHIVIGGAQNGVSSGLFRRSA